MLLDVLGQNVPVTSIQCKNLLYPQLSGSPTDKKSYQALFIKNVLEDSANGSMKLLLSIIKNV